jgi:hypothetical protein
MPVGNVLVGDSRCDIEHDNTALPIDIISITEATKLLLTSSIPDIELDLAQVLSTVRRRPASSHEWSRRQGNLPWQSQEGGPQHRELRCTSSRTHQSNDA